MRLLLGKARLVFSPERGEPPEVFASRRSGSRMSAFQWMGRMSPVAILLPGLIDIHCHGQMGRDAKEVNAGAFEAVRR